MVDNIATQAEEIEAICSIYDSEWHLEDLGSYSMDFQFGLHKLTVYITLPTDYPSVSSPQFQFLAPALNTKQKENLHAALADICTKNAGETVLFQLIEKIREYLNDLKASEGVAKCQNASKDGPENVQKELQTFDINHGTVIHDRKSSFQAHAVRLNDVNDVKLVMECLLQNKKIAQATHNILAYRIRSANGIIHQDSDDDGEAQAGSRLLHLLGILNLTDVIVVVSRWYGGIHLGPDRFRHINNAARLVLQEAGIISSNTQS